MLKKTREEVVATLQQLAGSPEAAHIQADRLVLQFLRDLGYADIAKAYEEADERIGFWYA